MKKTIYTLAITTLLTATVLTGCQTSTKKEEMAKDKVADAREDMADAAEELMVAKKEATAEEWKKFKAETNVRITENESRIAELKVKMKNTGNSMDAMYAKKIDELEQKNKQIKIKVDSYKNDTSDDWESFKKEYNHDMDQLSQALKDMAVDNKK
ncbi:hypothetical protein ACFX5E_03960 [Flavobacterium sp. LS2P90]|uniref:Uncharacterized protein n=1 Tax=Flavobacterium xylosi TaxID=3230415 RepID=A0ABW6HTF4_9FLAO